MATIEIVHADRYGLVFGAIGLSNFLEMVVDLLFSLVPRFLHMASVANLCSDIEKHSGIKTKNRKKEGLISSTIQLLGKNLNLGIAQANNIRHNMD